MARLTDRDPVRTTTRELREAAETYRGGEDRPLSGYAAAVGVFVALVAAAAGVAAALGRRAPSLSLVDVALLGVSTHKVSRTIGKDAVTSPLRAPFTTYRQPGGPAELMEDARTDSSVRHALGELLTCPFCLDMWIATGLTIGLVFAPRATRLLTATFSAVAAADFLQLAYAAAQRAAEK